MRVSFQSNIYLKPPKRGRAILNTTPHICETGFPDALIMNITGHSSEEMVDHYTEFTEKLVTSLASQIPQNMGVTAGAFLSAPEQEVLHVPREIIESLNGKNWKKVKEKLLARKNDHSV